MAKVMYLRQIQTNKEPAWNSMRPENTLTCVHFALSDQTDEGDDGPSDPGAKPSPKMIPKVTSSRRIRFIRSRFGVRCFVAPLSFTLVAECPPQESVSNERSPLWNV